MSKKRVPTLVKIAVAGIGALITFIAGLFGFVILTTKPLHPNPQEIPYVAGASVAPQWAGAAERSRQIMLAGVTDQNLPGVSVAVGIRGQLVWAEGYGWADMENRVKVTPDTRFKVGMASKVLTSAAAGQLIDQGKLNLDDEIQKHVPDFPKKQWPITLRHLMAHTAGLPNDEGDEGPRDEHCDRTFEGLRLFKDYDLKFEPGTRYNYSNYGWILVSAAVEAASGEPFLSYMRRQIFEPLGMTSTRDDVANRETRDRAVFYFPRFGADTRYGPQGLDDRDTDYSCFAGSGAFLSTPSDLVRFGLAFNGGTLVKPETQRLLQTSQRLPSGEETGYGLGWDIDPATIAGQQVSSVGHDGDWVGGRVMSLVTIPDRGIVVAVMANEAWADTFALAVKVAEAFQEKAGSLGYR